MRREVLSVNVNTPKSLLGHIGAPRLDMHLRQLSAAQASTARGEALTVPDPTIALATHVTCRRGGVPLTLLMERIWAMFRPSCISLGPVLVGPGGPNRAYVTH